MLGQAASAAITSAVAILGTCTCVYVGTVHVDSNMAMHWAGIIADFADIIVLQVANAAFTSVVYQYSECFIMHPSGDAMFRLL